MGHKSRKNSMKFEVLRERRRRRTCADRWRRDALALFRKRRMAEQRRRTLWLVLLLTGILSGLNQPPPNYSIRRKFNDENRNTSSHATTGQRPDESPSWAPRFSRAPVSRRNSHTASGRLTRLVRESRNTRSRSPSDPLCSNAQERPRLL